jgi:hypothetical protein
MPFAYYRKLSPGQKRVYRASDKIERVEIPGAATFHETVELLEKALTGGGRLATQREAQNLMNRLTDAFGVGRISVKVLERRPSWATGELHGLYEAGERGRHEISVWMRTAKRVQVVKFKTFLRTLLHELCHHLDYEHFRLAESYHTEGFYKRESSLLRQLYAPPPTPN